MFKICFHCWHHVEGSRRKLKAKNKCKSSNPYIEKEYVNYIMKERCCKCGKVRNTDVYQDYRVGRGLEYPNYEEG